MEFAYQSMKQTDIQNNVKIVCVEVIAIFPKKITNAALIRSQENQFCHSKNEMTLKRY